MQFAILVSTVIAILLGSFLTLTQTQQFFKIQSDFLGSSINEANAGIEFSLDPQNKFADSISIDKDNLKTTIKKNSWGGYQKIESRASAKTKSFTKIALTGAALSKPNTGVFLGDTRLPLVLVGDTQLEGDAYISDKGIKAGVIAGHYYNGKELVKGTIRLSSGGLPKLEDVWLENVDRLLNYIPSNTDIVTGKHEVNTNSFFEKTKYIYGGDVLTVDETYIGNIIIKSETEIIVSANAMLTDVMVVSPKITIQSGFKGNASFMASEQIKVEERVTIAYPSALVLIDQTLLDSNPTPSGEEPVFIAENSTISGIIIYIPNKNRPQEGRISSKTNIAIEPDAIVEGMVYCDGNVELTGTVIGSVYTQRFVAKEFGSVYVNHIYNGKVLGNNIHPKYCGLPFEKSKKGVVKWLY